MRLDGVCVLDLTRYLPGPYATQLLCDAGADVYKIEDANGGDPTRWMDLDSGDSTLFDAVNSGKRSVALDLKSEAGREAFYRLAAEADVVIEGFRPGVTERLGVDYATIREHRPDIVYCSLSGYGGTGPYRTRPGHDLNYAAFAGLLDMTRVDEDATPQATGVPVGDMAGGVFAAFSVVGALCSRELGNTGGEYLDIAITDVLLSFAQALAPAAFSGENPRPGATALTGDLPWYDVYATADGEYVTLAALEPHFWEAFCEAIGREELIDAHMSDDSSTRAALREELVGIFASRTREEWETSLADVEATVEPVRSLTETLAHPQTASRDLLERPDDEPPRIGFPARSSDHRNPDGHVPRYGEHTASVLREAGYDENDLAQMNADETAVFGE